MTAALLAASPECERAVIGAMLVERFAMSRAFQMLSMGDFDDARLRLIFGAIEAINDERPDVEVDPTMVSDRLRQLGDLEKAGGPKFLAECIGQVTSPRQVEHYARFVKDASLQRQIDQQLRITHDDRTSKNVKELGDLILALQGNRGGHIFDMREDMAAMLDEILEHPRPGIKTHFATFDHATDGVVPEELWTIGARPGAGKTAFMLKSACNMAQELARLGNPKGECILYCTTEMTVKSLVQRILPMATGVPHARFRSGSLTTEDVGRVLNVCSDGLDTFPLKIMGRSRLSIEDIKGAVFQAKPKVVFIDYLQRCRLPRAENMAYQIQEFMAELKSFMVDCGIAGFIGCQTDRELDKFPDVAPTMAHLKGSGGIEAESDGVVLLWEPTANVISKRMDWVAPDPACRAVEGIVRKARSGEKDMVFDLQLEGALIKMTDRAVYAQGEFA